MIDEHGCIVATGQRDNSNGLYTFKKSSMALVSDHHDQMVLWHRCLGHLSYARVSSLSKTRHVHGLPTIAPLENQVCECCLSSRQHRERFPRKSENRSSLPGQKIHSDLMGPMQHTSLSGSRYALVFTDDFSRKSWVFFLKHKSETITKFLSFKKQLENETGRSIQVLRTDCGGEYMSNEFMSYCKTNGIRRELTQANTP